ncbi:MAG: non-hydrolyzing UDP-N-acetylglucosamine 2-epimerase [Acidobacteriota bacterium]|nr:UDP-N-acetylglucosamine 2-epimerase (non-hydrolyzing) [Bryobacteraceae bacterium CoA2 C42]MCA2963464.1 UDP-N-acetylglucosamine 2-epimerase (non-hydrolyzing) [Acidobacteriaceae bacterium]
MQTVRVLFLFGTRPEAIKLCPVVLYFQSQPERFEVRVCVTAQHRGMLDQVLGAFGVKPDYDLNLMQPGQTLFQSTARMMAALEPVLTGADGWKPEIAFVQGDTTTTLCGALAAFYARVPVGHIEAGLRTGDLAQPFPEEMNRVLTGRLAELHFGATAWAAENLRREGVAEDRIWVTGNTGIDAVLHVKRGLEAGTMSAGVDWSWLDPARKLIVVTAHRRESFGTGFTQICEALAELANRPDVAIVYPVHPNPNVRDPVDRLLAGRPNIHRIAPLDYVAFVDLMRRSYLLITDSGGVQEEGPSLGKPILVLREKTERPEAVAAGTVKLVGTNRERIVSEACRLLNDPKIREAMALVHNPYGDGRSSERIADATYSFFSR